MKKVFVLSIDMGYGHQRTAYALKPLAMRGEIINTNSYKGIPDNDRELWINSQSFYEFVSRFKKVPVLGSLLFAVFDKTQAVEAYYTTKNLTKPTFTQRGMYPLFQKGWGSHLIDSLAEKYKGKEAPPIVSTFFTTAFMAEYFNYPGEIFCVVCDTDISRSWAPLNPKNTRIRYFAPTERAYDRLKMYGVPEKNIYLTGYPLPLENIGGPDMEILKEDVKLRIANLDPNKIYQRKYGAIIERHLGNLPSKVERPLTIMFAVGGAGAQKEYGIEIVKAFTREIRDKMIKVILVAGTKENIKDYFEGELRKERIDALKGVEILYEPTFEEYYDRFNKTLRKTDLLWTKPSELSFYANLGLPIIIAPTIGSHEDLNKEWILGSGFGFAQKDIRFVKQWLMDEVKEGNFAKMAMQGYVEGNQLGVLKIKDIISKCCG
ncbi:MAG: hypothetical protein PHW52_02525 [Candidatus Pacebacteria bacterium]|nr:hypothetical protein [Candidatus Paceibacterota bacterium]